RQWGRAAGADPTAWSPDHAQVRPPEAHTMTATFLHLFRNRFRKRSQPKRSPRRRRRYPLWLEPPAGRVTPSVNPPTPFELDGNLTHTAPTHDWDQIFADGGSPTTVPSTKSFTNGPTSLALAGAFINDAVNTTSDDIFTGGGSKDTN